MKKKQPEFLDVEPQLIPVTEMKLGSSLEQLSLEQLFELLKITLEIESSEQEFRATVPAETNPKTLH